MMSKKYLFAIIFHAKRSWLYLLTIIIMIFLIAPTLVVMPMSLSDTRYLTFPPKALSVEPFIRYFQSIEWQTSTRVSIISATLTMLLATTLGTAAAYAIHTGSKRGAGLLRAMLMAPMIVPVIFIAIGIFFVYAKVRLNYTIPGLILAHTLLALPYVIINVEAGLRTYDMRLEYVARTLGASRLKAFLTVTLPQIRFSVVTAALFSFAVSIDEAVVSLFISGGDTATLTRRMFSAIRSEIDPLIAVVATLMTLLSIMMLVTTLIMQRHTKKNPLK